MLYRCWQLKEGLRDLYRLAEPDQAPEHLRWWLAWACRSRIPAFVALAKTVRANADRILAAVELGLSNDREPAGRVCGQEGAGRGPARAGARGNHDPAAREAAGGVGEAQRVGRVMVMPPAQR